MSDLFDCTECMNRVERENDFCDECLALDCVGCRDEPLFRMGSDNMDVYSIPCPDCGRDEWDYPR